MIISNKKAQIDFLLNFRIGTSRKITTTNKSMKSFNCLLGLLALCYSTVKANGEVNTVASKLWMRNLSASEICKTQSTWTQVPDKDDCRKFYICTAKGGIEEFNCEKGFHFNAEGKRCVPGNCDKENNDKISCRTYTVERNANDCTSYRHCMFGAFELKQCAAGRYFDAGVNGCLPIDMTVRHQCSCLMPDNTTLPNTEDCETYYRCEMGQAVLHQCPRDQYYNERIRSCLPDLTGVCLEHPTMPPTELSVTAFSVTQAVRECAQSIYSSVPHSSNCAKFYQCGNNGVVHELACPAGMYFDPVHRFCRQDLGNECAQYNMLPMPLQSLTELDKTINMAEQIEVVNENIIEYDDNLIDNESLNHDSLSPNRKGSVQLTNFNKLASKFVLS